LPVNGTSVFDLDRTSVLGLFYLHDFAALVVTTLGAHAMG